MEYFYPKRVQLTSDGIRSIGSCFRNHNRQTQFGWMIGSGFIIGFWTGKLDHPVAKVLRDGYSTKYNAIYGAGYWMEVESEFNHGSGI